MKQYNAMKAKHPDAILLFRVGDFYETFGSDAVKASETLGITLTRRNNGYQADTNLAGFPHHALDTYLPKLVRAGLRVAVCDQLEDPKFAKGIVKRGITELVTPGVAMSDNVLENKENNFLASVYMTTSGTGVAFLDISTGEFLAGEGTTEYVDRLLTSFRPKEILYEKGRRQTFVESFGDKWLSFPLDDWAFVPQTAQERLTKHFETLSLKGFGMHNMTLSTTAAGSIMHYLDLTQHDNIRHITHLQRIEADDYVWLDRFTIRNLELFPTGDDHKTSLTDVLDNCTTPMGSRMLKRWIAMPLKDKTTIEKRLSVVDSMNRNEQLSEVVRETLRDIGDLERLVGKAASGRITPRELVQLKKALFALVAIKRAGIESDNEHLRNIALQLDECEEIRDRIEKEIVPEPPTSINKGNTIASGVNSELDDLRNLSTHSKEYLANMQEQLSIETGITSLRISFNNVFGYYIEVRNTHKDKVPSTWIRKQTLTNAERYITEELKEYESKILTAEERIQILESEIYTRLLTSLSNYLAAIQRNAVALSELDVLHSFHTLAQANNYCRPTLTDDDQLTIVGGRHPVIETILPDGEEYIANDVHLDNREQQIVIVTGPNMAGKSALLRQTALIVLMAQIGSFVPAASAEIGIVDKIFTRVGASDNLSQGESTFMVEMTEAANILNNVTPRSLVLFDELGRGTSTYDGISLAWAIVEYLHDTPKAQAKTLFATHYHELNEMEGKYTRIVNYNVAVREVNNKIIFLRKLVRGGSEHSFGIHVAKLAGMPRSVVDRANEILHILESAQNKPQATAGKPSAKKQTQNVDDLPPGYQLSIFQLDDPMLKQIRDDIAAIDIDNLTPVEALNKLNEIKKHLGI